MPIARRRTDVLPAGSVRAGKRGEMITEQGFAGTTAHNSGGGGTASAGPPYSPWWRPTAPSRGRDRPAALRAGPSGHRSQLHSTRRGDTTAAHQHDTRRKDHHDHAT